MAKKLTNENGNNGVTVAELEREIRNLQADLISVASDIGDWKWAKIAEYEAMGLESPYDKEELHNKRQAARARINEIQEQIKELDDDGQ